MQEENKNKKSFYQGMKAELKKVIWPTWKQVVKSTFATIGFVLLISIVLVVLNFVFNFLNTKWFELIDSHEQQIEQNVGNLNSGLSGDVVNSGDVISSGDEHSGEIDNHNTNVESGE